MLQYNYELLSIARKLRQLTQKSVSEQTNISQGTLSKAENGLCELSREDLSKLSVLYDLPLSFFARKTDNGMIGHYHYRRRLSISEKLISSFEAKVQIIKMIVDDLMEEIVLPEYALSTYIPNDEYPPCEIARRIRHELKVYRGAVPPLVTLLENRGILVFKMDFLTDKIDGLTTITARNRKVIFLNSRMPNDRIRFSLAHELGHLVMHIERPPKSAEVAEEEANLFASEFLMPALEIKPSLYNLTLSILPQLKQRWGVSMRALIQRAYMLGAITQQKYRYFQILFSQKGYNKKEPIALPIESPSLVKQTIKLYKNELGYTDEEMCFLMRINQIDYQEWFGIGAQKKQLLNLLQFSPLS